MKERRSKKVIGSFILGMILFSTVPVLAQPTDIKGHWAAVQIGEWVDKGIISGYKDGSFKPNSKISKAEFITIVNKAFKLKDSSSYEEKTIQSNHLITRIEAAKIISKILKLDTSGNEAVHALADYKSISEEEKGYVNAVVKNGYLKGYPDNTFKPQNTITRAEAVAILYKASTAETFVKNPSEAGAVLDKENEKTPESKNEKVAETFTGWLLDYDCQGANPTTHTQACNEMPTCVASGLGIQILNGSKPGEWIPFDVQSQPFAAKFNALIPDGTKYIPTIKVTGYKVSDVPKSDAAVPETNAANVKSTSEGIHITSIELIYVKGISHDELLPLSLVVKDTDEITALPQPSAEKHHMESK